MGVLLATVLIIGAGTSLAQAHKTEVRTGVAGRSSADFCGPRVARNFLAPLSRMAPIEQIPRAGKLAFAPKGVRLVARGRLVVGRGWIGFRFSDEAGDRVRHLNWRVLARLFEVDAQGVPQGEPRVKRRRLGAVRVSDVAGFHFQVGMEPSFYRMDIAIRGGRRTQELGSFSRYFRVVRPRYAARLILSRPVVHRDETIMVRLGNYGTESLSSIAPDWGLVIERAEGNRWVPAPISPPPARHKPIINKLPPGRMGECVRLRIPPSEAEGRYRVRLSVEREATRSPDRVAVVTAGFEVSGRELK